MLSKYGATILVYLPCAALADVTPVDQALSDAFHAGELPGLHSTISELGDQRLAEVNFPGLDERWGTALGERDHSPETLHDLRSITKSVVGLLYGIALADGLVPPPEAPLYTQFSNYPDLQADPDRQTIRVQHALTMQMGLEWNEDFPYTDPRNSEIAMEAADDRIRYVLEQSVLEAPGQTWNYSGGAVALIGELIQEGSGTPLDVFAAERLFEPLEIGEYEWVKGSDGVPSAASGLRLTLPDLVKIGHLVARNGAYKGQQIVPSDWIKQSSKPRVAVDRHSNYGYLWYLIGAEDNIAVIAVGNGGQRLTIQPKHDLVTATYAGRYNDPDAWQTSLSVLIDFIVPEARQLLGK